MARAVSFNSRKIARGSPRVNLPHLNSLERAVIATDLSGKIVFWNSAAEKVYGWSWQEVIGRSIVELLVPNSEQSQAAQIMKQLRQGKTWTGPFKLRRKDGTVFRGTVTDQPMRDTAGNLIGIIGTSHPETGAAEKFEADKNPGPRSPS